MEQYKHRGYDMFHSNGRLNQRHVKHVFYMSLVKTIVNQKIDLTLNI